MLHHEKIKFFLLPFLFLAFSFLDFFFAPINSTNLSGQLMEQFSLLGYAHISPANRVFDNSNQIVYSMKKDITDSGLVYPDYPSNVYIQDKDPPGYMPTKYNVKKITLCEIRNTFFTTESVIINENGYHTYKHACHPRYWGIGQPYYSPSITCQHYNSVICVGHQHTDAFGHWFLEIFPIFLVLPKEIIQKSIIALPIMDFMIPHMQSIGIERWQLVGSINQPFYANKLYIVHSLWCGDLNRFLLVSMKQFFVKKYKLNYIKPTKFVLYNRKRTMPRSISNVEELISTANQKYPKYHWEKDNIPPKFNDVMRYFRSIKLLFAIHGSALANEIFMQEHTAVIEVHMSDWLLSFLNLGPMTGITHIVGRNSSIPYREVVDNYFQPNYFIRLVDAAMKVLKL